MAGFTLPVNCRQTATTAADQAVWIVRKSASAVPIYLRRLIARVVFDGTAAAATTLRYRLEKTTGVWVPGDGTAVSVAKKQTSLTSSLIAACRVKDTGLDTTGLSFGDVIGQLAVPASVTGTVVPYDIDFFQGNQGVPITLEADEGLAIRLAATAVIGLGIYGFLEFDE